MPKTSDIIRDAVESTRFIDTHEHLPDESTRLAFDTTSKRSSWDLAIQNKTDDWSFLFTLYGCDDLLSAGLKFDNLKRFWHQEMPAQSKFDLIAPFWKHVRHTGYGQALRRTIRILYREEDLTRESAPRIAEKYQMTRTSGFYEHILRGISRVDHCQVNSFTHSVFQKTERPDLLRQDINLTSMTDPARFAEVAAEINVEITTLDAWLHAIDTIFNLYAPQAAAVKLQTAYSRNMNFAPVDRRRAECAFQRYRSNFGFGHDERVDLHNFLIRYVIHCATDAGLAIKLHTGIGCAATLYGDPRPVIPLDHARNHQSDLCRLYQDFPESRFVIFHIGYPYHHEVVAMAKQYPNVYVDMCWAWIIDPAESVRFLRSYLATAPSNKIFTFGGDSLAVEVVVGHAHIARLGITLAITSLVEDHFLDLKEAPELIEAIMRGNALTAFGNAPARRAAISSPEEQGA